VCESKTPVELVRLLGEADSIKKKSAKPSQIPALLLQKTMNAIDILPGTR